MAMRAGGLADTFSNPALADDYLGNVASGCTLDGQSSTSNGDTAVGAVAVGGGVATPTCVKPVDVGGENGGGPPKPIAPVSGGPGKVLPKAAAVVATGASAGSPGRRMLQTAPDDSQARRQALARQVIALNLAFFEAQRGGVKPSDSDQCANPWGWKQAVCIAPELQLSPLMCLRLCMGAGTRPHLELLWTSMAAGAVHVCNTANPSPP
jgi:hypothetical protein